MHQLRVPALALGAMLILAACAPAAPAAPTPAPKPTEAAKPAGAPAGAPAASPAAAAPAAAVASPAAAAAGAPAASPAAAAKPGSAKPVTLSFLVKNLVNPYFVNMQRGAENAGKKFDAQVRTQAPARPDNVEDQIQLVEGAVQAKPDGIILLPVDSQGMVPAVNKAKAANVPVFTADTRLIGTDVLTFVGADYKIQAVNAAKYVVDWAKKDKGGSANIIVLEGVPAASSTIDRGAGFKEVLDANPQIKVLGSQTANFNRVQGASVTENLLTRFPNADLILAMNDEMALGAIEAVKARGKAPGKDIQVIGINAAANALEAVSSGELAATVYANEYCIAYKSVELAVNYVRNGTPPPKEVLLNEPVVVTKENLAQFTKLRDEQAAGAECR